MIKKIVFMGSPDFACFSLNALIEQYPNTKITVISQPDKAQGRGKKIKATDVKLLACEKNLEVHTPESKDELATLVTSIHPDLILVVAYGMIIPSTITDQYLCINIHGSLLPKYRGASPVQAALLNGDSETGITLIKLNERMDAGPILATASTTIPETSSFESLYNDLGKLGARTLIEFLDKHWPLSTDIEIPQTEADASYCKKILKSDTELLQTDSAETKYNKIRAFSPKPGAYMIHNNKRLKILEATLRDGECIPKIVQPEGKNAMNFHDYCCGHPGAKEILNAK